MQGAASCWITVLDLSCNAPAGRVFGLHSGDGRQLWSLSYPPTVRLAHAALWRASHDAATPPQVLLLGSTQDGRTFYSVLDAHHGVQTSEGTLPYPVTQVGLRPSWPVLLSWPGLC